MPQLARILPHFWDINKLDTLLPSAHFFVELFQLNFIIEAIMRAQCHAQTKFGVKNCAQKVGNTHTHGFAACNYVCVSSGSWGVCVSQLEGATWPLVGFELLLCRYAFFRGHISVTVSFIYIYICMYGCALLGVYQCFPMWRLCA